MLLHVILLYYISVVSAGLDIFNSFSTTFLGNDDDNHMLLSRHRRQTRKDYDSNVPSCEQLAQTSRTPFIVLLLYKTSGRFLGMGSIIDKKTVLTASQVVEHAMNNPLKLLALAGRLSPWWGKGSQVQPASEIYQVEHGLAIVTLRHEFNFNKNVLPIKIPTVPAKDMYKDYGTFYAVFGLQRTGWDIPGEATPKGVIYQMKVESVPKSTAVCLHTYPDYDFNETVMTCTHANGSWAWGCLGSPTVALNPKDQLLQIAVVVKTTFSDTENYHFHLRVAPFEPWIRAHSLLGYKQKK